MPRRRDERRVAYAGRLAASGVSRAEIAEQVGTSERTVSRWLGRGPGRPRAEGEVSRTTAWRRARTGRTGEPVNKVIAEAVREKLDREESTAPHGTEGT